MTEEEEKLRMEAEEREHQEAEAQLSLPVGGTPASKFRIQLTGGAVELAPSKAGLFQKDEEIQIRIAGMDFTGWVKTIKLTTEKRGGVAVREAVVVLDTDD
jgi:hypothetical protein